VARERGREGEQRGVASWQTNRFIRRYWKGSEGLDGGCRVLYEVSGSVEEIRSGRMERIQVSAQVSGLSESRGVRETRA
jgi:hypothetical protein